MDVAGDIKVLLIGGTSHVGKSTFAERLARHRGWKHISTDQFARHPGRPWRDGSSPLPDDVIAYYSRADEDGLLESVLEHYRSNVWPIAEAVARSHWNNPYDPGLVLEGSAILPELVHSARLDGCHSVWLTGSDELITERIVESSHFDRRDEGERRLIEAFRLRSLAFNTLVVESATRLGERCLDVDSADAYGALALHAGAEK